MFPTVVEFQSTRMPIRRVVFNKESDVFAIQVGSSLERRHVRPVTDAFLNSANNFPRGCTVVSYDPINQMTEYVRDSGESISSTESGIENTALQKHMLAIRVLKRLKLISEEMECYNRDSEPQTASLICSSNHSWLLENRVIGALERMSIGVGTELV